MVNLTDSKITLCFFTWSIQKYEHFFQLKSKPYPFIILMKQTFPDTAIQININGKLFLDVLLMGLRGQSTSYASFITNKELIKTMNLREKSQYKWKQCKRTWQTKRDPFDIRKDKLKGSIIIWSWIEYILDKRRKTNQVFMWSGKAGLWFRNNVSDREMTEQFC